MADENCEIDALARQIREVIKDNRKFLERIMDDGFEPEEEPSPGVQGDEELPVI